MDNLHWELSVLSKAIHYKNLSGAADHVGLSQPQLSRIVSKLESSLNVVLLDRSARRKSGWTPVAFKVADTYFRSSRKLTSALQELSGDDQISQLSVGTLEGLSEIGLKYCHQLFQLTKIHAIELSVFDISDLEERFEKDELDVVFTMREPGKQKYKHVRSLGYQVFEKIETDPELQVMSPFEFSHRSSLRTQGRSAAHSSPKVGRYLLSNSLAIRRSWVETYGGIGEFPSPMRTKKTGAPLETPVYLIASDLVPTSLWEKSEKIKF
jgi:DNA-binding transcriptional LysR family regulator